MEKNNKISVVFGCILYLLQLVASTFFLWVISRSQLLPNMYKIIIEVVIIVFAGLSTVLLLRSVMGKMANILRGVLVFELAACLVAFSFIFPIFEESINKLQLEQPTSGQLLIDVIALKDTQFTADVDLLSGEIGVQTLLDIDNQNYALTFIKSDLTQDVSIKEYSSFEDLLKALYKSEVKYALLNESYLSILADNDEYANLLEETKVVYQVKRIVAFDIVESDVAVTEKAFNILIIGQNQSGKKVSNTSNTDVVLLVTVNPSTKQVLLTSMPRDSYVTVSYSSVKDKLTHAGIYGANTTVKTVSTFLGTKIDFYIRVNYNSLTNLVNTVGGITVNNPYKFKAVYPKYLYTFDKGNLELDGKKALAYVRERKDANGGDVGRNEHQRIVLEALVKKISAPKVLVKFNQILQSINGTYLTNITTNQIYSLAKMQLADLASWNILQAGISGSAGRAKVASLSQANEYSVVFPYTSHISKAKSNINKVINGTILTAEDVKMPKN